MPGERKRRPSIGRFLRGGKSSIIIILIIVFLIVDGVLGWYIVTYSVADKNIDETTFDFEILQMERSFSDLLVLRSSDAVFKLLDSPIELGLPGVPVDMALGDDSNAIAVLTDDHRIHYFPPGQITEQFFIEIEDAVALVGLAETYSSIGHVPENIVAISSNASGDALHMISIESQATEWTYSFESRVVTTGRSDNAGYFSIALDNHELVHFARFSSTPRMFYNLSGPIDEVKLAGSGTYLVVLFDNGTMLSRFGITSSVPTYTVELPTGSRNVQLRDRANFAYVQTDDRVLEITDGSVITKTTNDLLISYTVPLVIDKLYISVPGELWGYKGNRALPNWKGQTSFEVDHLKTDIGGDLITGWSGNGLARVDDAEMPLGDTALWTLLGFVVIFQFGFLIVYGFWDNIRNARKETLYIVVVGAIAGLLVSYIFPDWEAIDWYGLGVYISLAAILAAISTLVAYRTEAGLANIVVGVVVGVIMAIPLALVTHFLMQVGGYQFPDSPVYSLAKLVYTGLKMGLVGGIVGWIAQKVIKG